VSPAVNASGTSLVAPLSLRVNVSWTVVGSGVHAACQWGVLIALARLGSPEAVGQFALALAIAAPVIIFSQLQLRAVQATDARRAFAFAHYLTLRLITTVLALGGVVVLLGLANYGRGTILVTSGVALAKAFDAVTDAFLGRWQQDERMDAVSITFVAGGIATLLAAAGAMALTGSAAAAAFAWAAVAATNLAAVAARSTRMYRLTAADAIVWDPVALIRLGRLALPLGFVMMLISLNASIPRYFLAQLDGLHALGIFAAVTSVNLAGGTVMNAVGQSMSPRLSRAFAAGDTGDARAMALRLTAVGTALGLGGLLVVLAAGRSLLALLYGDIYAGAQELLVIVSLAAALGYIGSALGYMLTAARQFALQAPVFATVALATTAAAYALVPSLGLAGAGWSLVVGAGVQLVASAILLYRLTDRGVA
jgi:O-antigen/teichoic acid export membrane protein